MPRGALPITPTGWGVLALSLLSGLLGHALGWTELVLLGTVGAVLLLTGLILVSVPVPARAFLETRPTSTTAGGSAQVEVAVRAGIAPILAPEVEIGGDLAGRSVRLRTVSPGTTVREFFEVPTPRRGVYRVGPLRWVRGDLMGLYRRRLGWHQGTLLRVRPRVVHMDSVGVGGTYDLEGLASNQLSANDLAFHALREYVPGDDLRHVHWRSSAKADTLLVRQYLESRSLRAVVLVDDEPASYAHHDEFETAVSIALSISLRSLRDGFEVTLSCGGLSRTSTSAAVLLDLACDFTLSGTDPLLRRAEEAARVRGSQGFVTVVSGGRAGRRTVLAAVARFPATSQRIAIEVDAAGRAAMAEDRGITVLTIDRLDALVGVARTVPR